MKIIYITHQVRNVKESDKFEGFYDQWKLSDPHQLIWATRFATEAVNHIKEYELESWTLYDESLSSSSGIVDEDFKNIRFRSFPATKIFGRYVSLSLIKEIRKKVDAKEKVLFHLQSAHDYTTYFLSLFLRKVPLICTPRSGSPPIENFHSINRSPKKLYYLIAHFIDKFSLNFIDFIFVSSIGGYKYLIKEDFRNIAFERTTGVQFNNFKLRDKNKIRTKLGLPLDKKIVVFVGRYNKWKGADNAINVYNELKNKIDLEMIFIGGSKEQPFFENIIKSGAIEIGFIGTHGGEAQGPTVHDYLVSADVYLSPCFLRNIVLFAGIGTTPTQAAMVNTPVVGMPLLNFQGTSSERNQIGVVPKNKADLSRSVMEALNNPERFRNAREISKKYFSWERIMEKNLQVYRLLDKKYYR